MVVVKMLGVLVVILAIVLRAECALTITGLSNVMMDLGGTFTPQTAMVTENVGATTFSIMDQSPGTNFMIVDGVLDSVPADKTFTTAAFYALVIKAVADTDTANSGTVSISVIVEDMPPVFAPTTYLKTFTGDQAAGSVLITVTATDPGLVPKAAIGYSLITKTGDSFNPNTYMMVESDGKIKVMTGKTLKFGDNNTKYEFVCKATLAGEAVQTAYATVKLEYYENGVAAVYSSVVVICFALMLTKFV